MPTNTAQSGCTCCDTADGTPGESPTPTNLQTRPSASRIASAIPSCAGRCRDRSRAAAPSRTSLEPLSTRTASRPPKSRSSPASRRSNTTPPSPPPRCPTASTSASAAGRDPNPSASHRPRPSGFFPPREYSPSFTFAFGSIEISSVSGSFGSAFTAATLSKIASVSFVFFNGLPF